MGVVEAGTLFINTVYKSRSFLMCCAALGSSAPCAGWGRRSPCHPGVPAPHRTHGPPRRAVKLYVGMSAVQEERDRADPSK